MNEIPDFQNNLSELVNRTEKFKNSKQCCELFRSRMELLDYIENELITRIEDGWILDADVLSEMLDIYIYKASDALLFKIVFVLEKYYKNELEKLINKWIEDGEHYEKCSIIVRIKNNLK